MLFLLDAPARAQRPCQIFPDRCLCRRPLEISLQNLGSKPKWKTPTSPKGRRKASMAKVRCGRDRTKPSMGCYHYIGDDYDLMIAPNAWHDGSRGSGRRRWTEINFSGNCCKLKNWNSFEEKVWKTLSKHHQLVYMGVPAHCAQTLWTLQLWSPQPPKIVDCEEPICVQPCSTNSWHIAAYSNQRGSVLYNKIHCDTKSLPQGSGETRQPSWRRCRGYFSFFELMWRFDVC